MRHFGISSIWLFLWLATALAQEGGPAATPTSKPSPAASDAATRDIVRTPTGDPQLRININVHTAVVRALAFTPDSARLCTAGLDKVVQVWNLRSAPHDLQGMPLPERTVRWQVVRGLRGSIQALACAPTDGLLALGGYGAMGSLGEILLVDPVQGSLDRVLQGHLQPIASLAFSADGKWLASVDTEGRAILWQRGEWKPRILQEPDSATYGLDLARKIAQQPRLRAAAIIGSSHVMLPVCFDSDSEGRPLWRLRQFRLDNTKDVREFETPHHGIVTALAAAHDGSRVASADLQGRLFLRDLRSGAIASLEPGATVLSLAFAPDGRRLAVGTALVDGKTAQLQLWDVESQRPIRRIPTADHVHACAISRDGAKLAYVGGKCYEVFVESPSGAGLSKALGGTSRRVLKVAFAKNAPNYRVAFGSEPRARRFNDYADLEHAFDTQKLQLVRERIQPDDWLSADFGRGDWSARWQRGGFLQLYRGGQARGRAACDTLLEEGSARSFCWIPDAQGNPWAIAVGTDGQNSVYVFRLAEQGNCPILRHFRGHNDYVASLGVSRDLKYLASGSADGTVAIWNLSTLAEGRASRFGATWTVEAGEHAAGEPAAGETLVVRTIDPAGPLYFKGVRAGDTIREVRWYADREGRDLRTENRPARMLAALDELPWGAQVQFSVARRGVDRPGFALLPAWQPMATLFCSVGGEWAFWTPEGYYDASANGHRLFGWQVNRGLERLPAFYQADQFRRKLEQPAVLERLLPSGSLTGAFDAARRTPRGEPHDAVPEQVAATPAVEIVRPRSGGEIAEGVARVTVKIDTRSDVKLLRAKVYANGVVAPQGTLVARSVEGNRVVQTFAWDVPLPADDTNLIQVIAGTDAEVTGRDEIQVRHASRAAPARPRMHIRAVGIDRYADPEVPPLAFPVADAKAVIETLQSRSKGLYDVDSARLLANDDATPDKWRACLQELADEGKRRAGPNDLIVLFLAGHGWADAATGEYYYIGPRFRLANLGKSYADCIAWSDFRVLGEIPCRKLVILDTCHSGAIQPLLARNMKAAIRQLQDDVVLTLAASQGEQLAAENRAWKHGVFTKCLLDALEGRGEPVGRRNILLDDVVHYVRQVVPRVTSELTGGAKIQQPAAAPADLMAYVRLPLTQVEPANVPASSARPGAAAKQP